MAASLSKDLSRSCVALRLANKEDDEDMEMELVLRDDIQTAQTPSF